MAGVDHRHEGVGVAFVVDPSTERIDTITMPEIMLCDECSLIRTRRGTHP